MSTVCYIANLGYKHGTEGILCTHDGYPEYNGAILVSKYGSTQRVTELLKLGMLYALGEKLEPAVDRPHEMGNFQNRVCCTFCRDMHRRSVPMKTEGAFAKYVNEQGPFVPIRLTESETPYSFDYAYFWCPNTKKWLTYEVCWDDASSDSPILYHKRVEYAKLVQILAKNNRLTRIGDKTLERIREIYG